MTQLYKVITYIPEAWLEAVKTAMFQAGAGHYENYDCCSWQVLGEGQFRPLAGANPAIGAVNEISQVVEWRVEMVVVAEKLHEVIAAYKHAHPYETPAYDVYQMVDV